MKVIEIFRSLQMCSCPSHSSVSHLFVVYGIRMFSVRVDLELFRGGTSLSTQMDDVPFPRPAEILPRFEAPGLGGGGGGGGGGSTACNLTCD